MALLTYSKIKMKIQMKKFSPQNATPELKAQMFAAKKPKIKVLSEFKKNALK